MAFRLMPNAPRPASIAASRREPPEEQKMAEDYMTSAQRRSLAAGRYVTTPHFSRHGRIRYISRRAFRRRQTVRRRQRR